MTVHDHANTHLGFNLRKYKDKLLIKPAKSNVLAFVRNIKEIIKKNKATPAGKLIQILNPKITGWGNYYRHVVAKETFQQTDSKVYGYHPYSPLYQDQK